jgi:ubiquinone/menaquinone biosynthesis C-methylase UbiE
MNRFSLFIANLRALVARDLAEGLDELKDRAGAHEGAVDSRVDALEKTLLTRMDGFEKTLDLRLEERLVANDHRLDKFESTITERLATFEAHLGSRADSYEKALDSRFEERLAERDKSIDSRFEEFDQRSDKRAGEYETALDERIENRLLETEARADTRAETFEGSIGALLKKTSDDVDQRFDARARGLDSRLDDRLKQVDQRIDERFNALEARSDSRMETHERKVDGKIHQTSQDIVDRTDIMLQLFEQRLDLLRRKQLASPAIDPAEPDQVQSFRKVTEGNSSPQVKVAPGETPLYHQILAWKETAPDGLNRFTKDEQEVVDYLLSFVKDADEEAYVKQHLRRFLATLQRIPPAVSPDDKLLELGSLLHLAPAIIKYCGYREVLCADFWKSDEKVAEEIVTQIEGSDRYTFELRNFNVEADAFPYKDGQFRTVLCCELIEHLQHDPMHMLWECNRVLQPGGFLLLTTPNIASCRAIEGLFVGCTPYLFPQYNLTDVVDQHNREYAPYEIGVALAAAGFKMIELETEDVWLRSNPAILDLLKQVQISTDLRGDNIFALARKDGPPLERHPKELYVD